MIGVEWTEWIINVKKTKTNFITFKILSAAKFYKFFFPENALKVDRNTPIFAFVVFII